MKSCGNSSILASHVCITAASPHARTVSLFYPIPSGAPCASNEQKSMENKRVHIERTKVKWPDSNRISEEPPRHEQRTGRWTRPADRTIRRTPCVRMLDGIRSWVFIFTSSNGGAGSRCGVGWGRRRRWTPRKRRAEVGGERSENHGVTDGPRRARRREIDRGRGNGKKQPEARAARSQRTNREAGSTVASGSNQFCHRRTG